jgi:hypothetical protein
LRRVKCFGCFCQVEIATCSFLYKSKLMQVHINKPSKIEFIMPYESKDCAFGL